MAHGLQSARFSTTVAKASQLPRSSLPEVAFAGRSNSGKSSAINKLCRRNRLAFASKTPGRTQALNFFAIGPDEQPDGYLVDTPGYGYAAVPLAVKHGWQHLAGWYLRNRPCLQGVVLMIDCRRTLTAMDIDLLQWMPEGIPRLLLITKADKLGRMAQQKTLDIIQQQYMQSVPALAASFLLFSSSSGQGVEQARSLIESWFEPADDDPLDDGQTAPDAPAPPNP
ncbi:MAG: ribosome biogenesis GTP-binding protein YihA/YsxC [Burkholderiaceae bacterium]